MRVRGVRAILGLCGGRGDEKRLGRNKDPGEKTVEQREGKEELDAQRQYVVIGTLALLFV